MNAASRNSSPGFEILEDFPLPNSQVPPSQPVLSQPTVEDAQLTLADMRRLARGRVRPQPLTCTFVTDGVPCVAVLLCVDGLEKHLNRHAAQARAADQRGEQHWYGLKDDADLRVADLDGSIMAYVDHVADSVCAFKDCPGQRVNKPEGHYRNSEQTGRHPAPPYRLDQLRDLPGPQRSLKMPPLRPLPSLVPNYNLIALPVQPFSGNNINGTTVADLEFPILTQRDPDAAFHAAGHGPPNMWTSSDFVARAGGLEKDDDIEDEAQSIYAPSVSVVGSQMMNPAAFRHARAPSVMSDMSFVPGSPVATVERIARRQRVFEPASTPTPSQPFGSQPMSQSQSRNQMPPPATPSRFGALQQPPPAFGGVQVRAVRRQHAGLDDELPNPTRTERGAAPLTVRPVQYRLQPRLVQHVLDYIGDKLSKNHVVPEMQPKNGSEPQPLAGPAGPQPIVIDDADVFGPPVRLDKGKRKASPQDESQPPSILGTTSRGASTSAPGSRSPTANPGPPPAKVRRLTRIQTIREERAGKAQEEAEADFVAGLYAYRKTGRWNGFESLAVRAAAREVVDSLKGGQ